jgi:hypothetical protein
LRRLAELIAKLRAFGVLGLPAHETGPRRQQRFVDDLDTLLELIALRVLWESPPAFELVPGGSADRVPRFSTDGSFLAVDFDGPITTFGTGNFGRITDVNGFGRTFQFMLRFDW